LVGRGSARAGASAWPRLSGYPSRICALKRRSRFGRSPQPPEKEPSPRSFSFPQSYSELELELVLGQLRRPPTRLAICKSQKYGNRPSRGFPAASTRTHEPTNEPPRSGSWQALVWPETRREPRLRLENEGPGPVCLSAVTIAELVETAPASTPGSGHRTGANTYGGGIHGLAS
jgi:hypothetical protein